MHLVFFTKNEALLAHFKKVFAPVLKKEFFSQENDLKIFLKTLKVPTQVIIDETSFQAQIPKFAKEFCFHHIIIFTPQYTFQESLQKVRQGLLLVNPEQLMAPHWWWNRSLIQTTRKKISNISTAGVLLNPPTSVVNLYQIIYQHIDKLLFKDKIVSVDYISAELPFVEVMHLVATINNRSPQQHILYCAHAHLWAPYQRRHFLSNVRRLLPDSLICLETDGTQNHSEQIFDDLQGPIAAPLYQIHYRKAEKKIYQDPGILRETNCLQIIADYLELEHIRYNWKPDPADLSAFLAVKI
jgi:hypothetical protein